MKILITNDDGINAPGLSCHAETLRAATHRSTAGALVATGHVRALMADADARGDVIDGALLL